MARYSHFTISAFMCLAFGVMHNSAAAATTAEDTEKTKRRLRTPKAAANQQKPVSNGHAASTRRTSAAAAEQANARMHDFLDNDFDWDSRIPIPVGKPEDSHEAGRMLFNLDVDSIVDISGAMEGPVIDGTSQGSAEGVPPADESNVEGYIVNGRAAPQQTWYALTMEEINGQFYRGPCGATMVTREWAVTAAHCISNSYKNDLKGRLDYLYVGAYEPWTADSIGNGNAGRPYEIIKIAQHIEHWNHKPGPGSKHDIALLRLERPVSSNFQGFQTMDLGTSGVNGNVRGDVYGFGDTSFMGGNSKYLRQATLPYVHHNQCKQAMSKWGISDDMICFGGDGKADACSGDSGGPMIVNNKLVGVVSWGYKCNAKGFPGVYSSVAKQMDFINQASGYAISGRSTMEVATPAPPAPSPPARKQGSCSDVTGLVYYFHNDRKKFHTCAEIATKSDQKRAAMCQSEQRINNKGTGSPVSVSCKATCGAC